MPLYRYARWDGRQDVFPVHEDDLMEQLSAQLMSHGDVGAALRSLLQRGVRGHNGQRLAGVQDVLQTLRQMRQASLERYDLGSTVDDIKEKLNDIVHRELAGIDRRLEEVRGRTLEPRQETPSGGGLPPEEAQQLLEMMERLAERHRQHLRDLPHDAAGALRHLQGYEFMDGDAKARFDQLVRSLQERVLDAHLKGLSRRLQVLTPQDLASMKQVLRDLNQMLQRRLQGEPVGFQQFMQSHGHLFGPHPPASLDELITQLQRQVDQVESLLKSMPADQREELRAILDAVFRDQELLQELTHLAMNLQRLHPSGRLGQEYPFQGQEPLTLDEALDLIQRLQDMEALERQLLRTQQGASLADVDGRLLRQVLGEEVSQQMAHLQEVTRRLEDAGYIRKLGSQYELTPRGMRKIGQKALQEIFAYIRRDRAGSHLLQGDGASGERVDGTKGYEFGDSFDPHLERSLLNALRRSGPGTPVRLAPQDFEVYRSQQLAQSSTVLMVDLSLSMAMRGNFQAAKKVALALDNLIRTQFPRDLLHIVGFSTYAREVKPEKLPYLSWDEYDPYTNIQHGLVVSQKLLSKVSGGTKQIIMISDGEPTAHLEAGQLFLQYPPSPRTIRETLREVKRCTHRGIVINIFMLDQNSYLMEFVEQMARINRGRVFYTRPEHLGQYVLVDYFASRRRLVA